jgi:phosphotriesterase-related protein
MTAGRIRTVLGDIDPAALGPTMTHEHLLITFGRWRDNPGQIRVASDDPRSNVPISLETVGWVRRYSSSHIDNTLLDDEALAIEEAMRFKRAGGGALVDATNPDLKRDPEALKRISEATGLHVVMGAGHYVGDNHPLDMDSRSIEDLVAEIVQDVMVGAEGTDIRSGIIGEIGCTAPMTANEAKMLRAAARAQRLTGAALLIHPGRAVTAPLEAMKIVLDAGADPNRTIMSHIDRTLFEPADMTALAQTGCYLEFDLFGQESSYYPLSPIDMPNDAGRINHLMRLTAEGFGDKLLVAQDICHRTNLVKYGGDGYAHILENVVPVMRRKGMTEDQIDTILVRSPARVLTLVEPEG